MGIKMVVNQNKNLSEQVTEFEEGKKKNLMAPMSKRKLASRRRCTNFHLPVYRNELK